MESQDARGNTVRIDQSRARCEDLGRVCPAKPNRVRPTRDPYLDRSSDILGAWQTRSRSRRRANAEKLIGHGGIGSLTMTEAGADSLLIYGFAAWPIYRCRLGRHYFIDISAIAALAEDFSRNISNFTTSIMRETT